MIEVEYNNPNVLTAGQWQVEMAQQIASDTDSIQREIRGTTLVVRADVNEQTIRDAIEAYLPTAVHVETRTDL